MGIDPAQELVTDLLPDPAEVPADPDGLRDSIPALGPENGAYFNTGASGPSPRPVMDAMAEFHQEQKGRMPAGEWTYELGFGAYEASRKAVASHVGADPEEIALMGSTGDGLSAVAAALDLDSGDTIVRTDLEHPAGTLPWAALERRRNVEVRELKTEAGRIDLASFADRIGDADVVCFSSLSWNYGTRLPVQELADIASETGAFTLVDAVQEPGQGPLDFTSWGVDAVVASGHKWLLGPWGSGILYVNRDVVEELQPAQVTYRSVSGTAGCPSEYELATGAARFERGTSAPAPYVGLAAAIRVSDTIGPDVIRDRSLRLANRLVARLPEASVVSPLDPESGLVTVAVEEPDETVERLETDGLAIRSLTDPKAIRASVHAFNTEQEIDRLGDAIRRTVR